MTRTKRSIAHATLMIVIAACCFGSLTTLTLLAMRSGLSLVNVIFWRFALATIVLFVISARERSVQPFNKSALQLLGIGAIAQALISFLSFKALDYLPVNVLAFLFYTYPAWVAILSAVRGREALSRPRVIALILAMAGIAVMIGSPSAESLNLTGVLLALGTAMLYAIYLPMLDDAQKGMPPFFSTFYLIAGIALTFLIVGALTGQLSIPTRIDTWVYLLMLSVIGTVAAFGAMIIGLEVLGPVRTSIISTVEPFFTALLGALILREQLTIATLFGGVMIATAVIFLERSSERAEA